MEALTTEPIRFGILGAGMIAAIHAQALSTLPDARLAGVTDVNTAGAQAFAARYGIAAYPSYEAMLADDAIDAICICTPSGFHAQQALQAIRCGKHVVLEKPMALTEEDAERIMEAERCSGVLVTVVSQLRFSEDVQTLRELVQKNAFGQQVFCNLFMKYWRDPAYYAASGWKGTLALDGGGALMNQGIHGIDLLLHIVGSATVLKGCKKTLCHRIEVEDTAAALLEFDSGALGVIEASTCTAPGFERRLEIHGDRGYAVLVEDRLAELMLDGRLLRGQACSRDEQRYINTASDPGKLDCTLHARQLQNMVRAIRGTEPLQVGTADGRRAVELIRQICNE